MTNFILVTMMCWRACTPIQAEMFTDKAACETALAATRGNMNASYDCVPLVKTR